MFGATVVTICLSSKLKVYLDDMFVYNSHLELQNVNPYIFVFIT